MRTRGFLARLNKKGYIIQVRISRSGGELPRDYKFWISAHEKIRTSTGLLPPAPQAGVSTNFTTCAFWDCNISGSLEIIGSGMTKNFEEVIKRIGKRISSQNFLKFW